MDTDLKPLSMIYNEKSGFHANHKDEVYEKLMTIWTTHGFEIQDRKSTRLNPVTL